MGAAPITSSALDDGVPMEKRGSTDRPSHRTGERPLTEVKNALAQLEQVAGGRTQLTETLTSADALTPEEDNLVRMLADPSYSKYTVARLCHMNSVSVSQFLRLFSRAKGAQAYVTAITRIYEKLPDIAQDVAMRSLPHTITCLVCDGTGSLDLKDDGTSTPCKKCHGKGIILREPDLDRQEWSLQIGGLLKTPGGVTINNQLGVQINGTGIRTTSDFRAATDRLLYPGKQRGLATAPLNKDTVQEAEIVSQPPDSSGEEGEIHGS